MRGTMKTFTVTLMMVLALFLSGCLETKKTTSEKQEETRQTLTKKANASVPIPQIDNFLARKSVAEYMRRMDDPSKTFYIYLMGDNGNVIGYHVARTQTMNICSFMSPTDKVEDRNGPDVVRDASALDGIYYGGGACSVEYFFDAETDALIQIKGLNAIISDQPLNIDAEPINVKTE